MRKWRGNTIPYWFNYSGFQLIPASCPFSEVKYDFIRFVFCYSIKIQFTNNALLEIITGYFRWLRYDTGKGFTNMYKKLLNLFDIWSSSSKMFPLNFNMQLDGLFFRLFITDLMTFEYFF